MITYVTPAYAILTAVLAGLVAFLTCPWVIKLAWRVGAVDKPGPRKIHAEPIPRLGGIAVFLGCIAGWVLLLIYPRALSTEYAAFIPGFAMGTAMVFAIGILDDCYQLSAVPKFTVQLAAAYLAWHNGGGFTLITNPFSGESIPLGWLGLPATLFWIVLVTNAWNLIDGLDGLAATLGFIACAIFATLLLMRQQDAALIFVLPLLGSLLGFLPHNLNPARIFLGDSGSYLIGHQLALLSIITGQKGITSVAIFGPLAILGLPIIDTFLAIARRLLRRDHVSLKARLVGIFQADRSHLHHQALDRGWSPGKALAILASISFVIGLFGLWATFSREPRLGAALLLIAGLLVYLLYSHPRVVNLEDSFDQYDK